MKRFFSRIFVAVIAAVFLIAPIVSVEAAVLTGRRNIMSRQAPSVQSNHEIRFITSSGVDAPSDTITIDFPIGFDLASIGFADIDLYHGATTGFETNEAIAAAPAAGIWGASVSGRRLTLTAPTDAALGEIASNDIVHVRIGTNASGGSNQIVNPTGGGGPVTISIGGTFGDIGGIDVFIETGDTISISATIAGTTTAAGGGGGGSSTDLTSPTILNIQVLNITTSTAQVTWDTSEPATTYIVWGTDISYSLGVFSNPAYTIGHSVPLSALPNGTVIHFRITATDPAGNTTNSTDQTFSTLSVPSAPIISNVRVTAITDTSAIVAWDTDIPASSAVQYGFSNTYGLNASSPGDVTSHSVFLTGLSPATLYHFRVQSTEPSALLTTVSGDFTFTTTGDVTAPANVFGFTATPGNSLNTLNWTNPTDLDFSFVRVRARTDGYPSGPDDGRFVYQGNGSSFIDSGLLNGVTYYYANYAFDSAGNRASGAFAQATPFSVPLPPTTTPPTPPTPPVPPAPPTPTPPTGGGGVTTTPPLPPTGSATPTPPIVLPPTSTVEEPEQAGIIIVPSYYAGGGSIPLEADSTGAVGAAPGSPILVRVPVTQLPSTPVSAVIRIGNSVYALTPLPGGTEWGATFVPSQRVERIPATVQFQLENGRTVSAQSTIQTRAAGRVLERKSVTSDLTPVPGATVRLYELVNGQWQEWQGGRYGQANPSRSGEQGTYGFTVRNGQYRVVAEKEGYVTQQKDFRVTNNFASVDIVLPVEIELAVIGPIIEILQSEAAREAVSFAAPIAVAVAIANVAAAASLFSLLNYLWFLITQPVLLIGRKKRDKWGVVYNSLTKNPLDLAVVRLIQAQTRVVIQTRVTDAKGRYAFRVRPGIYRIEVVKPGFVFPTQFLKDETEDVDFVDLYHGANIEVKEEANLALNIPVDPVVKEDAPFSILLKRFLRKFQHAFSVLSLIVTIFALVVAPSWLMAGLVILQVFTYIIFRRLALPNKPKEWGIVFDSGTRKPLGTTVVRIFDKKFNKLLETQVTNSRGQYGFFASKSQFFVTAEKTGFDKYTSDVIDLSASKEAIVDKHIPLKKKS